MKVRGDFLGPPRSTDKTTLIIKVITILTNKGTYFQKDTILFEEGKLVNDQDKTLIF